MKNEARKSDPVYWSAPVHVRVGDGPGETIFGPEAAVEYLRSGWPTRNSLRHSNALRACTAATNRTEPPDFARDLFIAACIEADLLV
jgi:hypothetical protein